MSVPMKPEPYTSYFTSFLQPKIAANVTNPAAIDPFKKEETTV